MAVSGVAEEGVLTGLVRFVGRLLLVLVVVDLLLVALNASGAPSFLNMDEERNFPTWYSSAKLLLTALAAMWCQWVEPAAVKVGWRVMAWPAVALVFTALAMDETATAHERLAALMMQTGQGDALRDSVLGGDVAKDSFAWPILLSPLVVAVLYLLVNALWMKMKDDRRNLAFGLAGCGFFLLAVVLEGPAVYTSPPIEAWGDAEATRYALFTLFEESAEVAGATLMLAAVALHGRMLSLAGEGKS